MDEHSTSSRKRTGGLLWLLVLVAVLVLWWYLRPSDDAKRAQAEPQTDRDAQLYGDPDDILVDLRDDADDDDVEAIERKLGIDLVLVSDQSLDERFYRAHVPADQRDALLATLSADPDVEIAEPDSVMSIPRAYAPVEIHNETRWEGFPNDPMYKQQWHMDQIHMPAAWKIADGAGVIVAVLDTGVAFENYKKFHMVEDLAGVEFVHPYDFVGNDVHANDDHGHGTHVTGTIAQATHNGIGVSGIARNVKIMPLKVLSGSGSGSVAGIADAIRFAADNGAHVINMSLGGRFPSRVLKKAVQYAHDKNVVVFCAAGNEGRNSVGYPAGYDGALAVAATQSDETTTFYSNYGKDIDIAAPGGNTREDPNGGVLQNTIAIGDPTHSGYYAFMGTSMAAPHVAGVAALVVGAGVDKNTEVEKILLATARKTSAHDAARYGAGILDAEAAVLAARGGSSMSAGSASTGSVLWLSALAPLGLIVLLFGIGRMRTPLAAVSAGFGAYLGFHAVRFTDVSLIPSALDTTWLALNAIICVGLAALVIRRR